MTPEAVFRCRPGLVRPGRRRTQKGPPYTRFLAVALTALALGSCTRTTPPASRPNVLLISIDTLRADRVGAYGYARAATPALDALARRGLRFTRAATVAPLTLPAHASLMTGTFPAFHGVRDNGGFVLADEQTTMAEVFRGAEYRTGGFVAAFVLDRRWGIAQGFDRYADDFDLTKVEAEDAFDVERPGSEVVDRALAWLGEDTSRPFFAWVHLYEPHAPYDPPPSTRDRFPSTPDGAYDAEVAAADIQIGRLLAGLAAGGRLDSTLVIAVGDHGESLGEHDEQEHGFFVYDATVRIPLIVAGPGVPAREVGEQARIVDVMPTLLQLAGIAAPAAVQGRNLMPLASGTRLNLAALSETWYPRHHFGWSELTAISDGRFKLIAAPRRELYDLQTDPAERRDLAAADPRRADALERALAELVAATSSRTPSMPRPIDPQADERLRALGYVGGSISHQALETRPRADPKSKIALYNLLKLAVKESAAGRVPEAIAAVQRALAEDADIVEAYTLLGGLQRKAGRDGEAVTAYRKALARDPENRIARSGLTKIGEAYLYLAKARLDRGDLTGAEAASRDGLALVPNSTITPLGHYVLADVYNRLGRFRDAEREATLGKQSEGKRR